MVIRVQNEGQHYFFFKRCLVLVNVKKQKQQQKTTVINFVTIAIKITVKNT